MLFKQRKSLLISLRTFTALQKDTCVDREEVFFLQISDMIKREQVKLYQCKRKNNQGTSCDLKLGSYFHTFLSNSLLHFRRFFLFYERTFPMTLCSNRTVSCHIRDWFSYKVQSGRRTSWNEIKTKNNTTSFSKQFNT